MIEVSQLLLLVLVEIIIGLLILSGLLLFFALRRKGRIRNAAHHLAQRVKDDKPARSGRLKTLLQEKYGYEGEELEQALHNISQAEMLLFQNLINGYIKDDQVHLQQVDVDEENLVLAYQGLKSPAGQAVPVSDGEGSGEEMARLQDENKRLSDELRVTMDTMGRMLNEYSSMFAGGNDKPLSRAAAAEAAEQQEEEASAAAEVTETDVAPSAEDHAEQLADTLGEIPDDLLDAGHEQASALDEEVSEIIDEVMEIADEMDKEAAETAPAASAADSPESLIDELEQVDIEVPELMPEQEVDDSGLGAIPDPDPDDVLAALGESATDPALEALAQSETDSALEELAQSETDSALEALAQSETDSALEELAQSGTDTAIDALAESDAEPVTEPEAEPEPEPGSLEDEWAKLLEEDAESKQDPGKS